MEAEIRDGSDLERIREQRRKQEESYERETNKFIEGVPAPDFPKKHHPTLPTGLSMRGGQALCIQQRKESGRKRANSNLESEHK